MDVSGSTAYAFKGLIFIYQCMISSIPFTKNLPDANVISKISLYQSAKNGKIHLKQS